VTHATDCPTIDKKSEGDVGLGKGPVVYRGPNMNPHVVDRLLAAAKAREIPVQLGASGRATPTDANVLQTTRAGVATGLVSVPNRYMHSAVETISLDDADRTAADWRARSTGRRSVAPGPPGGGETGVSCQNGTRLPGLRPA
jgi:endoglucanase